MTLVRDKQRPCAYCNFRPLTRSRSQVPDSFEGCIARKSFGITWAVQKGEGEVNSRRNVKENEDRRIPSPGSTLHGSIEGT